MRTTTTTTMTTGGANASGTSAATPAAVMDDKKRDLLKNLITQWNQNRLDLFHISLPNEDLEFHGVIRFFFQNSGQNLETKCIRVASDATVTDVIGSLIEKFRPDMRMLSVPSYALYELHDGLAERKLSPDEKPLLVQLNWHSDDLEGRFLLRNIEDTAQKSNKKLPESSFTRSISNPEAVMRRQRQQKLEKRLQQFRSKDGGPDTGGTLKIYGEALCRDVPYKTLLLSIRDNAAAVVREMLNKYGFGETYDPAQWCLVQVTTTGNGSGCAFQNDDLAAGNGNGNEDHANGNGHENGHDAVAAFSNDNDSNNNNHSNGAGASADDAVEQEIILEDDECPLAILMNHSSNRGSIMFHVRRRPADHGLRKRKKKQTAGGNTLPANSSYATNGNNIGCDGSGTGSGSSGANHHSSYHRRNSRSDLNDPLLIELNPEGMSDHNSQVLHLTSSVMEVGSANGTDLQLYGPNIHPRHCVIATTDGLTSLTPCHPDTQVHVNGQRIFQTTILKHGNVVKFGNSNSYQFVDPVTQEASRYNRHNSISSNPLTADNMSIYDSRSSPRAQSPVETVIVRGSVNGGILANGNSANHNSEGNYDVDGNFETTSTASAKEDNRSIESSSDQTTATTTNINNPIGNHTNNSDRTGSIDRLGASRGQEPILPAVLEFPEDNQEQFLARVITHLDVSVPKFKLAPAYVLYLCARYRASTHYRPELTPMERAHKLTMFLQHAAFLVRKVVIEQQGESNSQAFWLANASELLHFLKSDRHISAFSIQAQELLAETFHLSFQNLVNCFTNELSISVLTSLLNDTIEEHPIQLIMIFNAAMTLLRKCRINAQLIVQIFSKLFHWISIRALSTIISNPSLCTRSFGHKLFVRLKNLQDWADTQGLILAAECHFSKIVQCAHLLLSPKSSVEELANLSAACFKLNSLQLRALLSQYKAENNEQIASANLLEQTARAAESVADELIRAENREVKLHEDPILPVQLWLPEDGFSCDLVQGIPQGLAEFIQPLQMAGFCRLAGQPTSSGHWTVYMSAPRSPSTLSTGQPEIQIIRLQKSNGGMGLSIVAAKGAGQEKLGIYIKSVVSGGAADLDGRLAAGDQLLSVDNQSLIGITQEKAAELLVRTGNLVTLQVAKGGAVYHGLATLLQQPSPTPNRGPRSLSERDLRVRIAENQASASTNLLNHDVYNPGYSRTSSNNSINTVATSGAAATAASGSAPISIPNGGTVLPNLVKTASRSAYNLTPNAQSAAVAHTAGGGPQPIHENGFYQNIATIRNQLPSPNHVSKSIHFPHQNFDERSLRSAQNILAMPQQKIASNYYTNSNSQPHMNSMSMTNLSKGPSVSMHRLANLPEDQQQRSQYGQMRANIANDDFQNGYARSQKVDYYQQSQPHPQPQFKSQPQLHEQLYNSTYMLNKSTDSLLRKPQQQPQQQQQYLKSDGISVRSFPSANSVANNLKLQHFNYPLQQNSNSAASTAVSAASASYVKPSKSEDCLRRYHQQQAQNRTNYPSVSNLNTIGNHFQQQQQQQQQAQQQQPQPQQQLRSPQYSSVTDQQIMQLKNEMQNLYTSEEMLLMQQQQQQLQQQMRLQQQKQQHQQQQQQAMRSQAKLAEMTEEVKRRQGRTLQPQQQQQQLQQHQPYRASISKISSASQQQLHLQQQKSQVQQQQSQPQQQQQQTQAYSASVLDLPKGSFYLSSNSNSNANKMSISNPWEREEREKEFELRRLHAIQWRDQQISELGSLANRNSQQEEQLKALKLEREFERRAQEAAASDLFDDEDIEEGIREDEDGAGGDSDEAVKENGGGVSESKDAHGTGDSGKKPEETEARESHSKKNGTIVGAKPKNTVASSSYSLSNGSAFSDHSDDGRPKFQLAKSSPVIEKFTDKDSKDVTPEMLMSMSTKTASNATTSASLAPVQSPSPPERNSSFAVMNSLRTKDLQKKIVSFNETPQAVSIVQQTNQMLAMNSQSPVSVPLTLSITTPAVREDPNKFIDEASQMLSEPQTPPYQNDSTNSTNQQHVTPGVIGAQEVYRDPRTRRLEEKQAAQNNQNANDLLPEKLSFKEKMKMFAMESGEGSTPKTKSKISRAQREIDMLSTPPPPQAQQNAILTAPPLNSSVNC